MNKKILSLLLALTLIFSVLPISAFASEAETPDPSTEIAEIFDATADAGDTNDTTDDIIDDTTDTTDDTTDITNDTDDTTGDGGGLLLADPGEASCTCESFCSDADCVVCKDDPTQCFYYYCICEAVCAEGEANPDCPICKDDYSKCAQAVEVPELEAMTPSSVELDFTDPTTLASGDSYEWDSTSKTLTLTGITLNVDYSTPLITTVLKLPADSKIDLASGTYNSIGITSSNSLIALKAIECDGSLTIKGSGNLWINSQNGGIGGSVGIFSGGDVTIEGGSIEVAGHDLLSLHEPMTPVAAIYTGSSGEFSITGGTVIAKSNNRVFKSDYVVPAGHSYWKSPDMGSPGGLKYVSTGNTTNDKIDDSIKNLKIIPGPNYALNLNDTDGKLYKYVDYVNGDDVTTAMANAGAVVTGSTGAWTLTLTDFEFETTAIFGLIVPEGTTIVAEGNNKITTTSSTGGTRGISSTNNLTISGTGTLAANGGIGTTGNGSIGIHCPNLTISGGTVIATGGTRALSHDYTVPNGYSYWRSQYRTDPQGEAEISTGSETAHKIGSTHKFAKIVANDSTNYTLYFYGENGRLYKDYFEGDDITNDMADAGAVVTGSAGAWTLTLTDFEFETSAAIALHVVDTGTTIRLIGNNTIETTASSALAINCTGALKINGTGSLNAIAANATEQGSLALKVGSLTIEGSPIINATTSGEKGVFTSSGDLNMTGGTLNAISTAAGSYGLSINGALAMTGGTIFAKGSSVAASVSGNVPENVVVKGKNATTDEYDDDAIFFTMPFGKIPTAPTGYPDVIRDAKITVSGGTGTDSGTGTGTTSSSGGSSNRETPAPAAPVITPMDDKSSGTLNNAIDSAASAASSSGKDFGVKLKNVSNFTKDNAAAIIAKAKALGKKATVSSDIMSEDGKYVEVRVTVDPELITKTVRLDGYIRESQTIATGLKFNKHFENKTAVVHLAQEGKFGQTAKIAAKVDLKDFNTANLFIYSYDKKANKYTLITSTNYKIDKNGYLVFNTNLGGDIIISDGQLVKK